MYEHDERIVLTLDAGGTNLVFSAIRGCREVVNPVRLPSVTDDLDRVLSLLIEGFEAVKCQLTEAPVAISFAFPGPADYVNGVIGDLPNFSSFRGGVALGSFLKLKFGIPVFINNDGNLFAYGEALVGALPYVNGLLKHAGVTKQYQNLIGITLGTGFGAGVVVNNELLKGDNGCGGDVWIFRNCLFADKIAEESVSVRAVKRVYAELSGDTSVLEPKDIFEIAEGMQAGDREAAVASFARLGKAAGDAIAHILTVVDGIVVIGGGLSGAMKFIMPALMELLNGKLYTFEGIEFSRLQMNVFDLDKQEKEFLNCQSSKVFIPGTEVLVSYEKNKYTAIMQTKLGTSRAISLGAYVFALNELDKFYI